MGNIESLSSSLFTQTQTRLYGVLFGDPGRSFYLSELLQASNIGRGTVQRELEKMVSSGLVSVEMRGRQKHYQADPDCPIYEELIQLLGKLQTGGARSQYGIRDQGGNYKKAEYSGFSERALNKICQRFHINKLSRFGSSARGDDNADSDVDVLVEFEPHNIPSLGELSELREQLSILFDGQDVDVMTDSILNNPYRKQSIQKDLQILYERQ